MRVGGMERGGRLEENWGRELGKSEGKGTDTA